MAMVDSESAGEIGAEAEPWASSFDLPAGAIEKLPGPSEQEEGWSGAEIWGGSRKGWRSGKKSKGVEEESNNGSALDVRLLSVRAVAKETRGGTPLPHQAPHSKPGPQAIRARGAPGHPLRLSP